MPRLDDLNRLIETTRDLESIVRTMKALASVSIRQYENAAESLREYDRTIDLALQVVVRRSGRPAVGPRAAGGPGAAVVLGSDHGLCGSFNDDIVDHVNERLGPLEQGGGRFRIFAAGGRAASRLEASGRAPEESCALPGSVAGLALLVRTILLAMDRWRAAGIGTVLVFRNQRTGSELSVPGVVQLLPVDWHRLHDLAERPWDSRALPAFTMERDALLASLLRQRFFVSVYRAAVESLASEHARRLAAMQAADQNIGDRLQELTGQHRRVRQESITEELLDIVSGFQALSRNPADRAP